MTPWQRIMLDNFMSWRAERGMTYAIEQAERLPLSHAETKEAFDRIVADLDDHQLGQLLRDFAVHAARRSAARPVDARHVQ